MFPTPTAGFSYSLQVRPDPDSQADSFIIAQAKQGRRQITDLPTWLQAGNAYITIIISVSPHRAPDLLAYQRIICDASIHSSATAWTRYDSKFRTLAALNPDLPWGKKNPELWLECFAAQSGPPLLSKPQDQRIPPKGNSATQKTHRPCTYCGDFYHYPENCQANPFRSKRARLPNPAGPPGKPTPIQPTSTTTSSQAPVCGNFNSHGCFRQNCQYRHLCLQCSGSHPR